jgi:hypothetical protein
VEVDRCFERGHYLVWGWGGMDDVMGKRSLGNLKEEELDRTLWWTRFGRGCGPVFNYSVCWVRWNRWKQCVCVGLLYSAFGKSLCTCKRCWKCCPRASIQAWTRLILFANTFCKSAFGKSLCTYKRCWKWCPRASIQDWTRLILFANTFYKSAFGNLGGGWLICL